jgi:hypothetical protein
MSKLPWDGEEEPWKNEEYLSHGLNELEMEQTELAESMNTTQGTISYWKRKFSKGITNRSGSSNRTAPCVDCGTDTGDNATICADCLDNRRGLTV